MKQTRRGICVVRRKSDGKIKCDMPDGTTQFITDEEWKQELARRLAAEQEAERLRARLLAETETRIKAELER